MIHLRPVSIQASITESIEGSRFAATLATALDGMKSDAVKSITAAIEPPQIAKAQATAAGELESARQAEETSFGKYLDARITNAKVTKPADDAEATVQLEKRRLQLTEDVAKRAWCRDQAALVLLQKDAPPERGEQCP